MRGHLCPEPVAVGDVGSIPADAGAPARRVRMGKHGQVYPRGCGGTSRRFRSPALLRGLSPRMRGHHVEGQVPLPAAGSIPADAGAPRSHVPLVSGDGVYPRGCGGTTDREPTLFLRTGLSPRMRGHQGNPPKNLRLTRSIPADAGAPDHLKWPTDTVMVYPRGCGGTSTHRSWRVADMGLSPRMRGHHQNHHQCHD